MRKRRDRDFQNSDGKYTQMVHKNKLNHSYENNRRLMVPLFGPICLFKLGRCFAIDSDSSCRTLNLVPTCTISKDLAKFPTFWQTEHSNRC